MILIEGDICKIRNITATTQVSLYRYNEIFKNPQNKQTKKHVHSVGGRKGQDRMHIKSDPGALSWEMSQSMPG